MPENPTQIRVVIRVNVGEDEKVFEATATAHGDPHFIAEGLLSGLDNEAGLYLVRTGRLARQGN